LFDINRNNGVVTASKAFKEQTGYDVTVEVQDEGVQHLKNKARFAILLAEELVVPR
jgi:maltose-binding protein MalE